MVRDLVRAAYAKWLPMIGREPGPMAVDYEQAVLDHRIDILWVNGRVVGLIETVPHADHLWIENVAVAPASQGNGFGGQLLAHAERTAIESGLAETRLLTNAAFEVNVAIYEKLGYRVTRTEQSGRGVTLYMSKLLG